MNDAPPPGAPYLPGEGLPQASKPVHAGEDRLRELAASQSTKVSEQAQRLLDWLANLPQGGGS